jgi:putative endonuclease
MALTLWVQFKCLLEYAVWSLGKRPQIGDSFVNGRYGEWLGRKLLKSKGFSIKSTNWRNPKDRRLEIDVVCIKEGVLVFVEIRSRSEQALVNGFHSINIRKRKSLLRAFKAYLSEIKPSPEHYRFDVVEIDLPASKDVKPRILHHENVAIFH